MNASTIIGDKHSNLILQGTSVKILWGNKFIDVIKNGKIATENSKFIFTISSEDEIKKDGIYLLNDEIWISIDLNKYKINSNSSYISYLSELKLNNNEKQTALKNIGFYYDNLELAQESGIESGIIFIKETGKLYLINKSVITEYSLNSTNSIEEVLENLYIEGNSLKVDTIDYITCNNKEITINYDLIVNLSIKSHNAIDNKGFKLYNQDGNSYLDVDFVNERYGEKNKFDKTAYTLYNTITNCEPINDNLKLTLLYDNKFKTGDSVFLISKNLFETITTGGYISEIKFKYPLNTDLELSYINKNNINTNITINSNSNTYNFSSYAKSFNISFEYELFLFKVISASNKTIEVPFDENILLNKYVYIAKSKIEPNPEPIPIPYIYNNNNSFEIYDDKHKLNTIIGYNSYLKNTGIFSSNTIFTSSEEYNKKYDEEYKKTSEDYSNAFWENIFKFPTYSAKLSLELKDVINFKNSNESDKNGFILQLMTNVSEGSIIPTIDVVKTIINNIIPKGTIVMWSGESIPTGWRVCDGKEGTPDLRNKFIMGSETNSATTYNIAYKVPNQTNSGGKHTHDNIITNKSGEHYHALPNPNYEYNSEYMYTVDNSVNVYKCIFIMKIA